MSQQIAALEKAVGGAVFDRPGGPRPVTITPLGKVVLAHARELLSKAQTAAEAIERFKAGESGRIDIGTFQSVSTVLLPQIVRQLRDEHPAVDIRLVEEETAVDRLLAGELDLIFWVAPIDGPIESVKLLDDPYVLLARRGDFPTARSGSTTSTACRWSPFLRTSATAVESMPPSPRPVSARWWSSAPPTTAPSRRWCVPGWARR